ncbi:MAG: NAD(+)/NADH kinase [Planctomycetes bacterium]|nr:NAD(+)/NADH kinase [Planctomycetota bacterium]
MRRVFLLANPDKLEAKRALRKVETFAASKCEVVGAAVGIDGRPAVDARADRIIVFGGDGTLIGVARSLGSDQIPLIAVNVGKLGFLAEFSVDELKTTFDQAVGDDSLCRHRMLLQVTLQHNGGVRDICVALNDCVIQAGPPFRLVQLGVAVDGEHLTTVGGDGLIVCTPSGSTAHNLSAGGPIMHPGVDAIILTPLNPHSLTHKPLVIERDSVIDITAVVVYEGTTVIVDGQVSSRLEPDDRLTVKRFAADCVLVHNPLHTNWYKLVTKLHWGRPPDYS